MNKRTVELNLLSENLHLVNASNKLREIEDWLNNPGLNSGHKANKSNDKRDYLWRQEVAQKLAILRLILPIL